MKKRAIVAALFLSANLVPPAFACNAPSGALSQSTIAGAIATGSVISCYPASGTATDQEILNSGNSGAINNPQDGQIGTYAISNNANKGIISYSYRNGSGPFAFYVVQVTAGSSYRFFGPGADGTGNACTEYNGSGLVAVKPGTTC